MLSYGTFAKKDGPPHQRQVHQPTTSCRSAKDAAGCADGLHGGYGGGVEAGFTEAAGQGSGGGDHTDAGGQLEQIYSFHNTSEA